MHGLVIRAFESFVRNTYGDGPWGDIVVALDAGVESFEPMFHYDDSLARALLAETARHLGKPAPGLLEDFGTFLVAHPASERVRRLLRFGGGDYEDFLASLEDLSGRARLAVPDLDLPDLELVDLGGGDYRLQSRAAGAELAPVLSGLLRALADDYGALVLIEVERADGAAIALSIRLFETAFAQGRGFALSQRSAGQGERG